MATLTTDIPVSTDLYTIDATSYDTFALTFVDGQVNRAQFPNVSVTFDFAAEAHAIIGEHGIEMTTSQRRTIAWIANDDMDTLADVVELIVSGRGGNPA